MSLTVISVLEARESVSGSSCSSCRSSSYSRATLRACTSVLPSRSSRRLAVLARSLSGRRRRVRRPRAVAAAAFEPSILELPDLVLDAHDRLGDRGPHGIGRLAAHEFPAVQLDRDLR